jgi:hypothetical protein
MKKIILATTLLVAFSVASFADGINIDQKLLKDLSATLKNSTQVSWINKTLYSAAAFNFNNKTALAFYDPSDNELIGFGMQLSKADLPAEISNAVEKKYSDWGIVDALTFIDMNGYINYFVQVQKDNKNLALKITPGGKLSIYAKMNSVK